jgi:hypothetical protein
MEPKLIQIEDMSEENRKQAQTVYVKKAVVPILDLKELDDLLNMSLGSSREYLVKLSDLFTQNQSNALI